MAENLTLARPYAEAAFALARDSHSLASWASLLDGLAAVAADGAVLECIANPRLLGSQLVQLLTETAGVTLTPEQHNFVALLIENNRAELLPEIRSLFVVRKNEVEGIQDAFVTSAFALDDAAQKQLASDLESRFGRRLRVSVAVDQSLIGGIRVAIGDEVIDASVRGKLATMAAALKN
ncbi:MAG: synthase, delta subunit [Pseudomonadota bacterium]|jgi:F-type H+-transporting ATPase subunit delta|nr:F0F1 ATP synthase subunit delta [Uliginosibacterium sp.]